MGDLDRASTLPEIRVPTRLTFTALVLGLASGIALQSSPHVAAILRVAEPVGALWLRALQMTILPLVAALLFSGVSRTALAARAGPMARRTIGLFAAVLLASGAMAAILMPILLSISPPPAAARTALSAGGTAPETQLPGLADFLGELVPANIFAAAAGGGLLPLVVFMALFALASTRLHGPSRDTLSSFFEAVAAAMLIVIGWVLALAPIGVLALSFSVAAQSGASAIAVLAHYIVTVSAMGALVVIAAYGLALGLGRVRLRRFAGALLAPQAVAISTQSSLASLPAMLFACRKMDLRESTADYVLPLAVALFRATSPAMNMAVAIYVAHLTGVQLTPSLLAAGVAVSLVSSLGAPSLPGTISYIANIGPIAVAMGVPIGPLGLLVAVEMLPDVMRTLGNVTMDVALATVVDRADRADPG